MADRSASPPPPDDWLHVEAPSEKKHVDWFDVASDEFIVAVHDSDSGNSSDEEASPPKLHDNLEADDPPPIENLPLTVSGVFYTGAAGATVYAAFHPDLDPLPDPALFFLPEPVSVKASAAGLLCCRGLDTGSYLICNPYTTAYTRLPTPTNHHGDAVAAVILVDTDAEYQLVCAYRVCAISVIETFDSRSWEWTASRLVIDAVIAPGSGVAAGAAAYWKTEDGMVVVYVPALDEVLLTVPPEGCGGWALGEMEGGLYCASVNGTTAVVSVPVLGDDGAVRWEEELRLDVGPDERLIGREDLPLPVRSQGGTELLFWEGLMSRSGRLAVVRNVMTGRSRRLADNPPGPGDDLVPYTSSLIRVKKEPQRLSNHTSLEELGRAVPDSSEETTAEELGQATQTAQATDAAKVHYNLREPKTEE